MVLEKVVSIRAAVRKPEWMFVIGGFVSVISTFIAFLVFPSSVGLFLVFLITIAMTPFMVNLMSYEEAETEVQIERRIKLNFFQRHEDMLQIYAAFFSGIILSLSILFLILPEKTVETIFENQVNEINLIRGNITLPTTFQEILSNNIGVLLLSFFFAFLFGSGAIFILAWNASVLASAIGLLAKSIGGVKGLPVAVLTFFPHGSLEIIAYFIAGIAGGLVSAVVARKRSKWFWVVMKDSSKLMAIAASFLILAAIVETAILSF